MNHLPQSFRRRIQLWLLIGVCGWSAFSLVADIQFRRDEAVRLQREEAVPPSTITLGSRHMAQLKSLASLVEAQVPAGAIVGVRANPDSPMRHRLQLAICLGYLLPRHHVKALRQRPRVEEYWLTVGHRLQRKDLEPLEQSTVEEDPNGAVYRVRR